MLSFSSSGKRLGQGAIVEVDRATFFFCGNVSRDRDTSVASRRQANYSGHIVVPMW